MAVSKASEPKRRGRPPKSGVPKPALVLPSLEEVRWWRAKKNFHYLAENYLRIRTKDGQLVPLRLNHVQERINATIERLREAGRPIRLIILKARQMGVSTFTEARIFHATAFHELTNAMIVAHTEDASTNLFNMSKLFFDEMPDYLKPMRKASNAKELVFENPTTNPQEKAKNPGLRSRIRIATADSPEAGRSDTIHYLHASEVAFWRDAKRTMLALLQAVPNTPNTMVVIESTANGVGGWFWEQWQRAKNGESDFIPLFFPWFDDPTYEMPVPDDFEPTEEERELMRMYPQITPEKLMWRRWCIQNNCGGDPELFKQEYPSNDQEAFLVSGRPRFDTDTLMKYRAQCQQGEVGELVKVGQRIFFSPEKRGYLEVWRYPDAGEEYYIGADVAKGLATGDYSAAVVFDDDRNMCALWHGHIDPDLFAEELYKLGMWYNEALIVVEENNHGLTVLNKLKDRYWNLYRRTTHDRLTDETKQQIGWYTSEPTKKLAINHLAAMIRERKLWVKSQKFIDECLTYVIEDDGKTNAMAGAHDDIVMASAIVLYVMEQQGVTVASIRAPEYEFDDGIQSNFVLTEQGWRHKSELAQEEDDEDEWFRQAGW